MSNIIHLSPALTICEPAPVERVGTTSIRLRISARIRAGLRTMAALLRFKSSLSDQTITATQTSDLLRRR